MGGLRSRRAARRRGGGPGHRPAALFVGEAHPELVRVFGDVEEPYSVWLVLPQANRRIAAVRGSEAIADAFRHRTSTSAEPVRGRQAQRPSSRAKG